MRVIAQADRAGHHRFRAEIRSGDTVLVAEEATHYMSPEGERVSRQLRTAPSIILMLTHYSRRAMKDVG